MRRIVSICLLVLSAVALVAAAPAAAAKKKKDANAPQITKVSPMRVSVGGKLTIRGKNFKAKRSANTVIFRARNGRSAFAKPRRASRSRLVVVVPASVSRLLTVANSRQKPTRLKLRVLAGTFSEYTSRRLSPVVTGAGDGDGDGDGDTVKVCKDDADHDNDLLANDLELSIGTDPCLEDTDGDTITDGWEYYAAKDLNIRAAPYPGKKPFPNALDPSDGGAGASSKYDFDGDGLTSKEEFRMWLHGPSGKRFEPSRSVPVPSSPGDFESPLYYSDGTKYSRASVNPVSDTGYPAWRSESIPGYGLDNPAFAYPATYNLFTHDDASGWRDDERDADADGLSNMLEAARGPGRHIWWQGYFAQDTKKAEPWPKQATTCGQEFGFFSAEQRPFADLDLADPDVDGDTLLDGEDDQDSDDIINLRELYEVVYDLHGDGSFTCGALTYPAIDMDPGAPVDPWVVNAFNPCAPDPTSRTCVDWKPFG